jgi:hypothetical protein
MFPSFVDSVELNSKSYCTFDTAGSFFMMVMIFSVDYSIWRKILSFRFLFYGMIYEMLVYPVEQITVEDYNCSEETFGRVKKNSLLHR